MLRKNQRHAIDISLSNDFASGVHFHATGTGKSLIASSLLDAYHEKHPQHNVLWLCEQKNILLQFFNAQETRSQKKKFLVHICQCNWVLEKTIVTYYQ
jgi:superfamily II DNA or RNA helicase